QINLRNLLHVWRARVRSQPAAPVWTTYCLDCRLLRSEEHQVDARGRAVRLQERLASPRSDFGSLNHESNGRIAVFRAWFRKDFRHCRDSANESEALLRSLLGSGRLCATGNRAQDQQL